MLAGVLDRKTKQIFHGFDFFEVVIVDLLEVELVDELDDCDGLSLSFSGELLRGLIDAALPI